MDEAKPASGGVIAKSMNLLVTGGAGFIGSNVIQHILDREELTRLVNLD